ncbi:hypothetical protein ABZ904_34650 [Streptomyces sp. NPDC046900]|uniref:hypothetical protein n=1 Tax=Streptomyces sp. NPDC046900 TaxID=3155473 RepID=UPI0033CCF0E9
MILSTVAAVVVASVPAGQTGVANGMNTNIRTLGGSLGAAATAAILTAYAGPAGLDGVGYVAAFVVLAAAMALAAGAALLIPHDGAQTPGPKPDPMVSDAGLAGPATTHPEPG